MSDKLTDDEKILVWLGYKRNEHNNKVYYVDETRDMYVSVLCLDRERLFLTEHSDPELDFMIIDTIREKCSTCEQEKFLSELSEDRLSYQPGDYARAARFLWNK